MMDQGVANGIAWLEGLLEVKSLRPDADEKCKEIADAIEAIRGQGGEIERLRAESAKQEQGIRNLQTALVMRDQRNATQAKRIETLEDVAIQRALLTDCDKSTIGRQASEIRTLGKHLEEFKDHEQQTHEILGAILGTDDSLEECAKRAMKRIEILEAALTNERAIVCWFRDLMGATDIGLPDDITEDQKQKYYSKAKEQLHAEGLL